MKAFLQYLFFLNILCFLPSCVPLPIKKHTSLNVATTNGQFILSKPKCDDIKDGARYVLVHPQLSYSTVSLTTESQESLKFEIHIQGKSGSTVKFEKPYLKFRYQTKDWQTVSGKLELVDSTVNMVDGKVSSPATFSSQYDYSFSKPFFFSVEEKYRSHTIVYSATLPKENRDVEIETPTFYLDSELVTPQIIKFNWTDRWMIAPLNGC